MKEKQKIENFHHGWGRCKEIVFFSFKYYRASHDCRVVIQGTTKIKKERKR